MSDNGTQPTSVVFMKLCGILGITQAFTSYNTPKGNAGSASRGSGVRHEY